MKIAAWCAAYMLGMGLGRRPAVREAFPKQFILSGLGLCLAGFAFFTAGGNRLGALSSTFYQSDVFAGYLILVIPVAAAFSIFETDRRRRILYTASLFFLVISLFFTGSRGAILVLGAFFAAWSFAVRRIKPQVAKGVLTIFGVALLLGTVYLLVPRNRSLLHLILIKAGNPLSWMTASGARFSFWMGGWKIFLAHPWFGSGLDTFGRFFPMVQEKFFWYSKYPHNFYVQLLSDGGLIFFAAVSGLFIYSLRSGIREIRKPNADLPLAVGLFFSVSCGALHLFLDVDSNFLLWSIPFWGMAGMLVSGTVPGTVPSGLSPGLSPGPSAKIFIAACAIIFFVLGSLAFISTRLDEEAVTRLFQEKASDALQLETRAIRFFPWDSNLFEHRSRALVFLFRTQGDLSARNRARADLQWAIKLDPVRPLLLGELADLLQFAYGENEGAETALKKAIDLDPNNYPLFYVELGDLALERGDERSAVQRFQEVITRFPESEISRLPTFRQDDFRAARARAEAALRRTHFKAAHLSGLLAGPAALGIPFPYCRPPHTRLCCGSPPIWKWGPLARHPQASQRTALK